LGERALGVIDDVGDANPVTLRTPQGSVVIRVPAQRSGKGRHRKESRLAAPGRRVGWGLADQAVSSITNFAVGIVVARSLGPVEFGIFGLAWVTYAVLLNISRGLATDPLAVRFSGAPTASWRRAVSGSSGTAILIGVVSGACSAVAGWAIGGEVGAAFVGLGIVLPVVLLQDAWRFAFIAGGGSRKAFLNDVVWAIALVPALLIAAPSHTVVAYLLAWGGSAAVAAIFGCVQARMLPRLRGTGAWLHQQRDLGPRYLVENVGVSGSAQIRIYGVGAIAGLADVGAIRGADLLIGPFTTLLMGLVIVSIPEAARVLRRSPAKLTRFCSVLGCGQALGALAWGFGLLLFVPDNLGRYVLGPIWPSASALILPATLTVVGVSFQTGASVGLRALGASQRSMGVQLFTSFAYITLGIGGAIAAGAVGSAWGVAIATAIGATVWWWQLGRAVHAHRPPDQ